VTAENRKGAPYVEDRGESRRTVANGKTGFTSRKKAVRYFGKAGHATAPKATETEIALDVVTF
jgi:hypothetical protein